MDWQQLAVYVVPLVVVAVAALVWLFLRHTVRTRLLAASQLARDTNVPDWMVVFGWTRKILYVPTIIASLAAAGLMVVYEMKWLAFDPVFPQVLGGAWLAVFFINFLIDEYEMDLRTLLMIALAVGVLLLWLKLMGWLMPFIHAFRHLGVTINAVGYAMLAAIFLLAIGVSWIRGLFHYVALTPNYLNIQNGPNETSEQISREGFSTQIDTGDFLERLLGFGQIVITFHDNRRRPLVLLVGRIGRRAAQLESIRSHLSVEAVPPGNTPSG